MSTPERPHADALSIHMFAYVQPTDPGMIGAKKAWVDTALDPWILKVRNSTNTGWVAIGSAAGGEGGGGSGGGHQIYVDLELLTQRDAIRVEGTTLLAFDDEATLQTVFRSMSTTIMVTGTDDDNPEFVFSDGIPVMVEYYDS